MNDKVENIFDYDLNVMEDGVLNPAEKNKASYLFSTPPVKVLCDLHLLFLIRRDGENRKRIMDMLRRDEESGVNQN